MPVLKCGTYLNSAQFLALFFWAHKFVLRERESFPLLAQISPAQTPDPVDHLPEYGAPSARCRGDGARTCARHHRFPTPATSCAPCLQPVLVPNNAWPPTLRGAPVCRFYLRSSRGIRFAAYVPAVRSAAHSQPAPPHRIGNSGSRLRPGSKTPNKSRVLSIVHVVVNTKDGAHHQHQPRARSWQSQSDSKVRSRPGKVKAKATGSPDEHDSVRSIHNPLRAGGRAGVTHIIITTTVF